MRKLIGIGMIVILLAALTACKEEESSGKESFAAPSVTPQTSEQDSATSQSLDQGKVLVAYFSWADNAVLDEDVDAVASPSVVSPGNVQELAGWVQEETGGDLFSIRVTEPYPSDWDACLDRANQERGENARPKLTEQVENLEDYDIVFLGFPNWLAYHKLIQCTQLA